MVEMLCVLLFLILAGVMDSFVIVAPNIYTNSHIRSYNYCKKDSNLCHRNLSHVLFEKSKTDLNFRDLFTFGGVLDIPEKYRNEIIAAEAKTPAAKGRATRINLYLVLTVLGVAATSFSMFLTSVRESGSPDALGLEILADNGFGWVTSNIITSFFFTNGLGGTLTILMAGFCGTMVEFEVRGKNENLENIWIELKKRKDKETVQTLKADRKADRKVKKKKRKNKRLDALREVVGVESQDEVATVSDSAENLSSGEPEESSDISINNIFGKIKDSGITTKNIFGKMKDFYNEADQMAASQALLLNKDLEDRGVIEKITDETGLKVIGKEEAEKSPNQRKETPNSDT